MRMWAAGSSAKLIGHAIKENLSFEVKRVCEKKVEQLATFDGVRRL